jgi:demethylmenaquinone methyltransferase / 2-methoxy-6-polyprenyl-1,4-benzoquinol methylase
MSLTTKTRNQASRSGLDRRLSQIMQTSPRKAHALELFAGISGSYDRWAQVLSFGQDRRWHDLLVERLDVGPRATVADVATGTGAVAVAIARRYGCRVVGIDQSEEMLADAERRIAAAGLAASIELVQAPAERLPLADAAVDALSHTYLLRYVDDRTATLRELARVVRPGGVVGSLEFGLPDWPVRPFWWLWTRAGLPTVGALGGPAWVRTGRFLGPSIERFDEELPLERQLALWTAAGIEHVHARRLSSGAAVVIHGRRARGDVQAKEKA